MNPEINKIVVEDNKEVSKEGFFLIQSTVENTLNKTSSTFQRQKPKRTWEVKTEKVNDEKQSNELVYQNQKTKTQIFNEQLQKVSKEEGISMSKARNEVYWINKKSSNKPKIKSLLTNQ